jgi:hypothetical protein
LREVDDFEGIASPDVEAVAEGWNLGLKPDNFVWDSFPELPDRSG